MVAQEVRVLASRTGEATAEIGALVKGILRQSGQADQRMHANASDANRLSHEAETVLARTGRLLNIAREANDALVLGAMLSEIELANMEELEIKLAVYRVFMGLSQTVADDFPDETQCRLGKWYYSGDGEGLFHASEGFLALEKPHREVHRQAMAAVTHYHAGELDPAFQALAEMERSNLDVMNRLRLIVRDECAEAA